MILYDQQGDDLEHPETASYIRGMGITLALRHLVSSEVSTCYAAGRGRGDAWNCLRTAGHLPPHVCADKERVRLVWTDE